MNKSSNRKISNTELISFEQLRHKIRYQTVHKITKIIIKLKKILKDIKSEI